MLTTLVLTLALSAPARADNLSLDLNRGLIRMSDPNWDMYSHDDNLSGWGLRAGYAVTPWLTGVVGYKYAFDGGPVSAEGDYDDGSLFYQALSTHELSLGPKLSLPALSWLQPYATLQGVALLGRERLDDDTDDDENLNELRANGFSGGALAAGGVDLILRRVDKAVRPTVHTEVGYAWIAPMTLGDLGQLEVHGLYVQWGVGARF